MFTPSIRIYSHIKITVPTLPPLLMLSYTVLCDYSHWNQWDYLCHMLVLGKGNCGRIPVLGTCYWLYSTIINIVLSHKQVNISKGRVKFRISIILNTWDL